MSLWRKRKVLKRNRNVALPTPNRPSALDSKASA